MAVGVYGGLCVENHSVYIMDRGGTHRFAQLVDISDVQYSRLRDAMSEATITIRGAACAEQADILAAIEPKRSEMVIYRGDKRVWEGPVNRVGWHSDWVEINARDIMDYFYGRPLSQTYNNAYPNNESVLTRLEGIINYEMLNTAMYRSGAGDPVLIPAWEAIDPPANVLPYVVYHHSEGEASTSAKTTPFQMTVGEHIDNYARNGGIDYTVVGRALHLWDTDRNIGQLRTMTEADFFGEVVVTAYGAEYASVAFAVADDGRYGGAGGTPSDWRMLEKSGPNGPIVKVVGTNPSRPSVVDFGTAEGWNGYRYWMAYRPSSPSHTNIRIAASKNGTTWKDIAEKNVPVTAGGIEPTLAFAWDNRLWLFWRDGKEFWRSRSENGKDWTAAIRLWTSSPSETFASPSMFYHAPTKHWVFFGVNTDSNPSRIVRIDSIGRNLDGLNQFGTPQYGTITPALPAGRQPLTIEAQRLGTEFVALITDTPTGTTSGAAGEAYLLTSPSGNGTAWTRTSTQVIPRNIPGTHDALAKLTFIQRANGDLAVWYGGNLGGTPNGIYKTALTGPSPVLLPGDSNMQYYGPWTKVFSVFDEDETSPPSQSDLNSQARLNLTGRAPVPVDVRVPDNSTVRLTRDINMDTLIPGVHIPLLATLNARQTSQLQKLDQVKITENPQGETIQIVLLPAAHHIEESEEG